MVATSRSGGFPALPGAGCGRWVLLRPEAAGAGPVARAAGSAWEAVA